MSFSESQGPTEKNPLVAFSIEKATRVCSVSVGGNVNINSGIRRFIVFKNWAVNVRREAPYVKRISTDLSLSLSLSLSIYLSPSLVPFSLSAENFFFLSCQRGRRRWRNWSWYSRRRASDRIFNWSNIYSNLFFCQVAAADLQWLIWKLG